MHSENHWALMAIDLAGQKFLYFDAMNPCMREANRHAGVLWRWLCDEAERRGYTGLQRLSRRAGSATDFCAGPLCGPRNGAIRKKTRTKQTKKKKNKKKKEEQEHSHRRHTTKEPTMAACGWEVQAIGGAPRQHNGYDCGVFMLMFARSISLSGRLSRAGGLALSITDWRWAQRDMRAIRLRIAADLTAKKDS